MNRPLQNLRHRFHCVAGNLLVALLLLLAHNATATLLFYDGFDYPVGEELGETVSSPPWENDKSQFTIAAGSLNHVGIEASVGNRVISAPTGFSYDGVRTEPGAWTEQSSGSLYCSFLLRVESTVNIETTGDGTSVLTIGRTSNSSQMIGVSLLNSDGMKVGVAKYPKGSTPSSSAFFTSGAGADVGSDTVLVVAKYDYVAGDANDTVTVWVNPNNTGGTEDPANNVFTSAGTDGTVALGRLTLCRGPNVSIDEMRIGQTWAEVTPTGVALVPSQLGFESLQQVAFLDTTLQPVVVDVLNAGGVLVPTNGVPVTLSLTAGSGSLNGTLIQNTGPDGRAVFTDLSFDTLGSGKEITATSAGLTSAVKGNLYVLNDPNETVVTEPTITQTLASASSFILRGDGGVPNGEYQLLSASNLNAPSNSWTVLTTNTFDGNGGFADTNALVLSEPHRYYRLLAESGGAISPHQGYASVPGPITGGGDTADIVVATNHTDFMSAISGPEPRIVYVKGTIPLRTNGNTYLYGNKTIIGLGTNATLVGNLGVFLEEGGTTYNATNIILRNLNITNPDDFGEDDGITVKNGGGHLWVDHCTIYDCGDGLLDVTREGDFVTVSWCRFLYTTPNGHENANLMGGSDGDTSDLGKLHVTFHHNWWGNLALERMPSVRFGRAHVFNNYFNCTDNNYCTRTRLYAEVLVENNHYEGVNNPWELATSSAGPNGLLHASGNITNNCTFSTTHYDANLPSGGMVILVDGTDVLTPAATDPIGLNPPPYAYTLDDAADIQNLVTTQAGAGKGPFAP